MMAREPVSSGIKLLVTVQIYLVTDMNIFIITQKNEY